MGASNAFQLRGRLPEDKKRLLDTFDKIILEYSEEDLRYYRKNSGIYNRLSLWIGSIPKPHFIRLPKHFPLFPLCQQIAYRCTFVKSTLCHFKVLVTVPLIFQ